MANSSHSSVNKQRSGLAIAVLTALGIVYGDIGTSPLYALREVFSGPHSIELNSSHIFGVLSLITWSLILVISIKYMLFVMKADNKGEGGELALTALAVMQGKRVPFQKFFLAIGLFGGSLLVGDSMITPAISVLSAVEGLRVVSSAFDDFILPLAFAILIGLFSMQSFGTQKIGKLFGPVMLLWFTSLALLGIVSIFRTPEVLYALSPHYALQFWIESPAIAFVAMSSVFLVVTGGEALYADMGHLGLPSIAKGWFFVALPGLLLNYYGQGALLLREPNSLENPFYLLAPSSLQIPLIVLATTATIIASQAVISGFFSLANQCVQLGYCPRLNIIHTSKTERGQIYVPMINWVTLIGTLWLVVEFKTSSSLAGAYGISVSMTMVITTLLTCVVAWHTWSWPLWRVFATGILLLVVDVTFLAANSLKIFEGGWVPIVIALTTFTLVTTWKKGRSVLFDRLKEKSCSFSELLAKIEKTKPVRIEGLALFMVGDAGTVPPALLHNLQHNHVLHKRVIFLTIVGEEVAYVSEENRVNLSDLGQGFCRLTGHYGFMESPNVMQVLKKAKLIDPSLNTENATFFLGREILVAGEGLELSFWRKRLFAVMARNAQNANSYFRLPHDQVIEVGMQIRL